MIGSKCGQQIKSHEVNHKMRRKAESGILTQYKQYKAPAKSSFGHTGALLFLLRHVSASRSHLTGIVLEALDKN
jgi:hypothetical protein